MSIRMSTYSCRRVQCVWSCPNLVKCVCVPAFCESAGHIVPQLSIDHLPARRCTAVCHSRANTPPPLFLESQLLLSFPAPPVDARIIQLIYSSCRVHKRSYSESHLQPAARLYGLKFPSVTLKINIYLCINDVNCHRKTKTTSTCIAWKMIA